jgi:predicted GNAT family acetyltransferase
MEVARVEGVADYTDLVQPVLGRDRARHNLILGILDVLRRRPDTYPGFHLWAVRDGDGVVGAAIQTPPYNLALARPIDEASLAALAAAIHATGVRLPGVVGGLPEADRFADAWIDLVGGATQTITRQGIYELTAVRDGGHAEGAPRVATETDVELIAGWHDAFIAEAVPRFTGDLASRARRVRSTIEEGGYWLWEVGDRPVAMTGTSAAPPDGVRVGPVYTLPKERGHGYATALVAHVSRAALEVGGRRACYLHTDLANATSNAIYQRIGYDRVCDAIDLRFVPPD